jgi:hypothetical protein
MRRFPAASKLLIAIARQFGGRSAELLQLQAELGCRWSKGRAFL